jgi:hypothetical protein
MLGALVYANGFTMDAIHKCGEASLGFPCEVFLRKKTNKKKNYSPLHLSVTIMEE